MDWDIGVLCSDPAENRIQVVALLVCSLMISNIFGSEKCKKSSCFKLYNSTRIELLKTLPCKKLQVFIIGSIHES